MYVLVPDAPSPPPFSTPPSPPRPRFYKSLLGGTPSCWSSLASPARTRLRYSPASPELEFEVGSSRGDKGREGRGWAQGSPCHKSPTQATVRFVRHYLTGSNHPPKPDIRIPGQAALSVPAGPRLSGCRSSTYICRKGGAGRLVEIPKRLVSRND